MVEESSAEVVSSLSQGGPSPVPLTTTLYFRIWAVCFDRNMEDTQWRVLGHPWILLHLRQVLSLFSAGSFAVTDARIALLLNK